MATIIPSFFHIIFSTISSSLLPEHTTRSHPSWPKLVSLIRPALFYLFPSTSLSPPFLHPPSKLDVSPELYELSVWPCLLSPSFNSSSSSTPQGFDFNDTGNLPYRLKALKRLFLKVESLYSFPSMEKNWLVTMLSLILSPHGKEQQGLTGGE